jgi:murein DD-endopeptidase MepM/ murein hydrolase activator NlpD/transposase
VIADGQGRAIAFRLAPGQAHELPHAVPLLERLPGVPKWVVGDRGYTSHAFREHIWGMGARPAIPPQCNEAPVACPDWIYNNRNQVERLWARLKVGAARLGADFPAAMKREDDPFRTIDVRIVPENVTTVSKTTPDESPFASRDLTLRRDQTLAAALKESGADRRRIEAILSVLSEHAVTGLSEGQHLNLLVSKDPGRPTAGRIVRVTLYGPEGIEEIAAEKDAGGFVAVTPPSALPDSRDDGSDAEVGSGQSFYDGIFEAVLKNGLPQALAEHLVRIFGYTVDMQRMVSGSDRLEMLYNPSDEAGALPDLLYASLTLNGEKHRAYRFETPAQGTVEYFDEKGGSLRRFLLRMPIAEGRVTSPFGTRIHPILHYARFHNGIDWANKAGTPIMSTGDGTVVFSGPRGGYGNRIEIRHANGYATAYNHMQRFSHAVHAGAHVRQGQVIGYMGSTGLSTGAHIHYEVSVNGRFLDPTKVRLPDGRGVPEPLMSLFERRVEAMNAIRHRDTVVSSATPL